MIAIILGLIAAAVLIGGFVIWSKKTNELQEQRMKMVSQEQFDFMKQNGVSEVSGAKDLLTAVAVLTNVKEGTSAKLPVDFIFYNPWTQKFELGEDKIAKELVDSKKVKVGGYITLVIKTNNGVIDKISEIKAFDECKEDYYVAKPNFYETNNGIVGVCTLTEGVLSLLQKEFNLAVGGKRVNNYRLGIFSMTDDKIIAELDYDMAIKVLEKNATSASDNYILVELNLKELKELIDKCN